MNHLVLFMYIIHLIFGAAGAAAMALLHNRMRRKITAGLLWVMGCLLVSVMLTLVQYYIVSNLHVLPVYMYMQYTLGLVTALALYGGLLYTMLQLKEVPRPAAVAATAAVAAVQIGRLLLVLFGSPEWVARMRFPSVLLISVYLFFLGAVLYRSTRGERDENLSFLIKQLSILTLVFAPASTIFYFVSYQFPVIGSLHISLDFIYFSLWSIITITALIRYLSKPTALLDQGKVSPEFISSYKITEREAEVIELISRGLSNKEIAERLFVSFTTARTHIYNIFRKTGAKSRVELLRILSGYRE